MTSTRKSNKQVLVEKAILYPDTIMQQVLKDYYGLRRYWFNKAVYMNQLMYLKYCEDKANKRFIYKIKPILITKDKKAGLYTHKTVQVSVHEYPTYYKVRDNCVKTRTQYDLNHDRHTLDLAIKDAMQAIEMHVKDPKHFGLPRWCRKKSKNQSFKTDHAKIIDNYLRLPKPRKYHGLWHNIAMSKLRDKFKNKQPVRVDISYKIDHWQAALYFNTDSINLPVINEDAPQDVNGCDMNVRFANSLTNTLTNKKFLLMTKPMLKHLSQVRAYHRLFSRRVKGSKNYYKRLKKLQFAYQRLTNYQHDKINKYCLQLIKGSKIIVIENLDIQEMKMSKRIKNLQNTLFGYFKIRMQQLASLYNRTVILADKFYPSTQRCSRCGYVKRGKHKLGLNGNKLDGEDHNHFICLKCGLHINRDYNAALNLRAYYDLMQNHPIYLNRICTTNATH